MKNKKLKEKDEKVLKELVDYLKNYEAFDKWEKEAVEGFPVIESFFDSDLNINIENRLKSLIKRDVILSTDISGHVEAKGEGLNDQRKRFHGPSKVENPPFNIKFPEKTIEYLKENISEV